MDQNSQDAPKQLPLIDDLTVSEDHAADVNGGRSLEQSKERLINYTGLE